MEKSTIVCLSIIICCIIGFVLVLNSGLKEQSQRIADRLEQKEAGYTECVKAFKDESQCFKAYFSDFRG